MPVVTNSLPSHIINRSTRKWVFGSFEVPAGVPTARIVPVPERLHPRGPHPETHTADDAKDEKFKRILLANLDDDNTGLARLPDGSTVEVDPAGAKARADEIAELKAQNAKLQRLVAVGDTADAAKELQELNDENDRLSELLDKARADLIAATAGADKAREDAKYLFDQATAATNKIGEMETELASKAAALESAGNRIAELEAQLKSKKR